MNRPIASRVSALLRLVGRRASAPLQAWQILAGGLAVLLPALFLTILGDSLPVTTPGIIFIFGVALTTYLAGWTGGVTALVVATIWLDLFFIGDRDFFSWPKSIGEAVSFILIVLIGAAMIVLIEQVKHESAIDRREAIAARAATAALATLEASSRSDGEAVTEEQAMRTLLDAMLRANRAHGGIVLLYDATRNDFERISHYGVNDDGISLPERFPADMGFAGRIAVERRPGWSSSFPAPQCAMIRCWRISGSSRCSACRSLPKTICLASRSPA